MTDTRSAILALLQAAPGLRQLSIAGRLGVSERTARRHLSSLIREGAVLVMRDGSIKYYSLADHAYQIPKLPRLTEGEAEALSVAALAAREILAPTPIAEALDRAASKLRRSWVTNVFSFEPERDPELWSFEGAAGGRNVTANPQLFRTILHAVRSHTPITADYFTASRNSLTSDRRLGPLGFLVRSGAWLVVALDLDSDSDPDGTHSIKDFALAGFRRAELRPTQVISLPKDFDLGNYARDRFGALAGAVEEVRLLVEPEAVPAFCRKLYNPTQQIEELRADGRAVVSFEAGGLGSVKAWVLSWGPKVRVLTPGVLARDVAESHRSALRAYEFTSRARDEAK